MYPITTAIVIELLTSFDRGCIFQSMVVGIVIINP